MNLIEQIQRNIAETSVGASALRSQGASGVIATARKYFKEIDLKKFSSIKHKSFPGWLDEHTETLRNRFPGEAKKSWGGARKAMNLFLRGCLYNTYLSEEYRLREMEMLLEVPLDKDVATGLIIDARKENIILPKWDAIKRLTKRNSDIYQQYALKLAQKRNIARVHLDLAYWRKDKYNKL